MAGDSIMRASSKLCREAVDLIVLYDVNSIAAQMSALY